VVIKGGSAAGGARIAKHLENTDVNERMEVLELRGVAAKDLRGALQEMEEAATACPNCRKPFYHASINTRAGERLSDPQRYQAIDRLERELGLTGQPRVVVVHEKKDRQQRDREHCHVVWSRIDLARHRTISDSHNYRKHELVARELERAFGHERVQGAHIEREGRPRPERTPSHAEMQQGARTGITPQAARAHITKVWQQSDTGAAFAKALEDSGWTLARGDRRDFVVIDPKGGVHSLARRIEGAKVRDVRARLVDIDISALPSVAEARAMQRARVRQEAARPQPPASGQRPAPRPARVVTSAMRRALATRTRLAGRLARTMAASHHFTPSLHGASDDAIILPAPSSPAALPIPRSAAPVNPRAWPERGGDPRTDSPRDVDHPRALDWRNQSRALVARSPPVILPTARPSKSKPVKVRKSKRISGASRPQIVAYGRVIVRDERAKTEQTLTVPTRPMATGGMCYAQRMDLQAAIAGKITWAEYNRKWGGRALSL
jgi:Relaxase/Mobilisation nuclease domain